MKTETRDIAMAAVNQVPGQAGYLLTGQSIIMVLTIILLLIQIGYYSRKWMRAETKLGVSICRTLCRWKLGRWFCKMGGCNE